MTISPYVPSLDKAAGVLSFNLEFTQNSLGSELTGGFNASQLTRSNCSVGDGEKQIIKLL